MARKKKKKKIYVPHPYDRFHVMLMAQIIAVYLILVVTYIFLTGKLSLSLDPVTANPWYSLLLVVYYFLPVVLAVMFGISFPPFWIRVRNLLVAILILQFLYSAGVYVVRNNYLNAYFDALITSSGAFFKTGNFKHELQDRDQDGHIDNVLFNGEIEAGNCPDGEYQVYGDLSVSGRKIDNTEIKIHTFKMREGERKTLKLAFRGDVRPFKEYFGYEGIQLNIGIRRIISLDQKGKDIRFFSQWAPFFKKTTWQGEDQDLRDKVLEIDYFPAVDKFTILPIVITP